MVPLSAVVNTEWASGPDILPHFNGFPAAKIIGGPAPGYSSGQAIAVMEELARDAAAGLHLRLVGPRLRGKAVRRHLDRWPSCSG